MPRQKLAHIQGLRAVAVLSVILFHLGVPQITGGFVGVDVFFVISGYLISKLIYDELTETGSFSYRRFYVRRIRRLTPALVAVVAAVAIYAAIRFEPERFRETGREVAASILSVANLLFYSQSGYFDADAASKPLLHMWSLSVEEQFYLIWPLLLAMSFRLRAMALCIVALGALSFALNALLVHAPTFGYPEQSAALYYWMPTRIFEFAIGAAGIWTMTHLPKSRAIQEFVMLGGLVAITASLLITTETNFPYWQSLLPALGTLAVITAAQPTLTGKLIANRPAVYIGTISYSLYLVHWPLIAAWKYEYFRDPTMLEMVVLFVVMLAAAALLYRHVEAPFQANSPSLSRWPPQRRFLWASGLATLALAVFGVLISYSNGWAWRMPGTMTADQIAEGKAKRSLYTRQACWIHDLRSKNCHLDRPLQVLIYGNSHEPDAYNAFWFNYGNSSYVNLIMFGATNYCDPQKVGEVYISTRTKNVCDVRYKKLADRGFISELDAVVYASPFPFSPGSRSDWDELSILKKMNPNIKLIVFGGYLMTTIDCATIYNRFGSFDACKQPQLIAPVDFFRQRELKDRPILSDTLDYLYIDNLRLLCADGTLNSCIAGVDGEPMFYDRHHRSLSLSRLAGQRMVQTYGHDLEKLGFPPLHPTSAQN